jgi:myo-inositol-1(or 4)-monophosphatase
MARSAILNVMVAAATKAARGLKRDFGEVENLQVSRKGPSDFVSAADHRAEDVIRTELQKARPAYGFLMEESGETKGDDPQHRWIVDPLDGTSNFLHGVPHFCISIALERQHRLSAGVIYNPITDELFTAERGSGAFLNDRRLRVAARSVLGDALVATGMPFRGRGDHDRYVKELQSVMPQVAGIRRFGAAALDLAYVAAGRFDGFWERDLSAWDLAAGIVIVREAGGYATDLGGRDAMLESGSILAGNEAIHRQLLAHLKA